MMKKTLLLAVILVATLASTQAFAAYTFIVESRSTGQNYAMFTQSGWATSSGNVNAPGCTLNIGSMYSGTGTYFGPSRYAAYSFTPGTTGWYEADLAWTLSAGQISTAVNIYTGANTGSAAADIWGNTGGPTDIVYSTTMNMYNNGTSGTGTGTWKKVTTMQMSSGTAYKMGIYGGYKTPYAGGATPADASANRVHTGAARFIAATPVAATYSGPADGALNIPLTGIGNDLGWAAGDFSSFFDIFLDTYANPITKVGENLSAATTSFDPDGLGLLPGTTYYWKVVAKNVDVTTDGAIYSFTTAAVPEPGSLLALGTGLVGLLGLVRRKK